MDIELEKYQSLMERNESFRPIRDPSAEMDSEEKSRFIQYLFERLRVQDSELAKNREQLGRVTDEMSAMRRSHEERMEKLTSKIDEIQKQLRESQKSEKKALRDLGALREKYERMLKDKYGIRKDQPSGKSVRIRHGENVDTGSAGAVQDANRTKAQDDFDGTEGSAPKVKGPESVSGDNPTEEPKPRDMSNHPSEHKWMEFKGVSELHPNDDTKVAGRITDRRTIRVYSLTMGIRAEEFEKVKYSYYDDDPKTGKRRKRHRWEYFAKEGHPETIPMFEGTHATPEFMQALAYEVFMKNTSIGTVQRQLADLGLTMSDNALNIWLQKGKKHLDRMISELKELALEKDSIVNCDESWCKVRKYDRYKRNYVWVIVNRERKIVILFYDNGSRGNQVLKDFVGDHELKAIMTDGYVGYNFIDGKLEKWEKTTHLIDWVHIDRKLVEAIDACPGDNDLWEMHELIVDMFGYEDEYRAQGLSYEEIGQRRNDERMKSTVARLKALLLTRLKTLEECTSDAVIRAIRYMEAHWDNAMRYREDGRYPMDNNAAERAFRPWAMKRKTTLQFGSDEGAEMAAAYHSIVETVKMCGRSVWHCFGDFFNKVIDKKVDIKSCLPHNLGLSLAGR